MPDWLIQVIGYAGFVGVTYGAIRQDLKNLHERVKDARECAGEAHQRIDAILMKGNA